MCFASTNLVNLNEIESQEANEIQTRRINCVREKFKKKNRNENCQFVNHIPRLPGSIVEWRKSIVASSTPLSMLIAFVKKTPKHRVVPHRSRYRPRRDNALSSNINNITPFQHPIVLFDMLICVAFEFWLKTFVLFILILMDDTENGLAEHTTLPTLAISNVRAYAEHTNETRLRWNDLERWQWLGTSNAISGGKARD